MNLHEYQAKQLFAEQSLTQFHLAGFCTNISFLYNLAIHPRFKQGAPSTHFIAEQGEINLRRGWNNLCGG